MPVDRVPFKYRLMMAARWMHVPPWELMLQPVYWIDAAYWASRAEAEASRTSPDGMT